MAELPNQNETRVPLPTKHIPGDNQKPNHRKLTYAGLAGIFDQVRDTGERITGGGIRAMLKRLFLKAVCQISRAVRRRPRLLAFTHQLLRPMPGIAARLNRLTLVADPFAGQIYIPSGRLSRHGDAIALTLPASARIIYLRLKAEASDAGSLNENK
jgi:hypothetical protein